MREININNNPQTNQGEAKSLMEEIKELKRFKEQVMSKEIKVKDVKVPMKAKVKGRKLKKGFIGILKIDENKNISMEKQKISGSSFKDKEGLYHATNGKELLFWNGKFPILIQPSWRNNPLLLDPEKEKNETYGQPYIKAKILADTIKVKKKGGNIIIWILIAGAALFAINYLMGGKFF